MKIIIIIIQIPKFHTTDPPQDYLLDFGYLAPSNLETGALRSKVELLDAIKNLQRMGGLEVTGDPFDPKLRELLKKNRWGWSLMGGLVWCWATFVEKHLFKPHGVLRYRPKKDTEKTET